MRIVHTMIRVKHLDESLAFYCDGLGMQLLHRKDYESGRFTNCFVGYGSETTARSSSSPTTGTPTSTTWGTASATSPSGCPTCTPPVTTCAGKG